MWELPQCILGVALTKLYKTERLPDYKGIKVFAADNMSGGISLGQYIILRRRYLEKYIWSNGTGEYVLNTDYTDNDDVKHEFGHTEDSLRQGPLYLLFTGLPSITWLGIRRLINKFLKNKKLNYYWFYTERRADRFGEVKRNHSLWTEI